MNNTFLAPSGSVSRATSAAAALLLASASALAQSPADAYNYSRTVAYTYYLPTDGAKNGLLASETVGPDDPYNCSVTTYDYDAYGNRTSVSVANCAGASGSKLFATRATTATYA